MNPLSAKEYQLMIAKTLRDEYGDTLYENSLDLDMAEAVVKLLKRYLNFAPNDEFSQDDFIDQRTTELLSEGVLEDDFEVDSPRVGMNLNLRFLKRKK